MRKGPQKTKRDERDDRKNEGRGCQGTAKLIHASFAAKPAIPCRPPRPTVSLLAMGQDDDAGSKASWPTKPADDSWSFYTAQAQNMGQKALSSTDDAIKTARVQINHLQDASSHHFAAAQELGNRVKKEYFHYEGLFFKELKDGVHVAVQNPNVTYGVLGVTAIVALRTPRRFLYRHTIGRFQSEQAMLARAETKVKEMRQSVDILRNETKKLEERAKLAEEELLRGRTKLKNTGSQLSNLSRSAYKTESTSRGLMDNLRDLPGREALRLRAEVAAMTSEAKQQRSALVKRVSKIAGYGISV